MKKIILFATAVLLLLANTVMADDISGKVGITARGGASYFAESGFSDEALAQGQGLSLRKDIKADLGWAAGGGMVYGITDNLAVNFDVIYYQADVRGKAIYGFETLLGRGKTIDFALGAQWRFKPKSQFIPSRLVPSYPSRFSRPLC